MFLAAIVVFHTQSLGETAAVAQGPATSEGAAANPREREARADGASPELRSRALLESV